MMSPGFLLRGKWGVLRVELKALALSYTQVFFLNFESLTKSPSSPGWAGKYDPPASAS